MKYMLSLMMGLGLVGSAWANTGGEMAAQKWSVDGVRGNWDKAEIYRGYQVFTGVCMACHSVKYVSHRDMMRVGFTEAEVKALAETMGKKLDEKLLTAMDEAGAKETFGKVPPDLSMMPKARHDGANYLYALLTGYSEDPEEIAKAFPQGMPEGASFNHAFPGNAIAMPNPLSGPDLVTYDDGTKATVSQMAHDVTSFLQWTAEPEKIERQRLGVFVLLFVVIFTILAYLTKRAIWKDIH